MTTSTFTGPNEIQQIVTSGDDVDEVQRVTTNATVVREVQTISTSANAGGTLGGTFSVTFDTRSSGGSSQTSGEISYDAAAEGTYLSVKSTLEVMKNIGPGGIHEVRLLIHVHILITVSHAIARRADLL